MLKAFNLAATWQKVARQEDPVAATFAVLRIDVGGEAATTYVDLDDGSEAEVIEQPMLYIAEWLVEQWWSLLWEPEKFDDIDQAADQYFSCRHSLQAAGHGFALPDVRIVPTGAEVRVSVKPYVSDHARVRFLRNTEASVSREGLEHVFGDFIDAVCKRLPPEYPLVADWALVRNTADDAVQFCRLKGALGLSPYVQHNRIETALDAVAEVLSEQQLLDLCQTATADDIVRSANVARLINGILESESACNIDLQALSTIPLPSDISSTPAYKRGYAAARALREGMGISEDEVIGGSRVFDNLSIDWQSGLRVDLKGFSSPISGAVGRSKLTGRLALVHEAPSSRRFAAARATYFFWAAKEDGRRLLTNAVTRDQQASRAFAAELLVPQNLIRSRSRRSRINVDQMNAIAEEAVVAPEVVWHQARNGGLAIAS